MIHYKLAGALPVPRSQATLSGGVMAGRRARWAGGYQTVTTSRQGSAEQVPVDSSNRTTRVAEETVAWSS